LIVAGPFSRVCAPVVAAAATSTSGNMQQRITPEKLGI
jgi:hypothetical protein